MREKCGGFTRRPHWALMPEDGGDLLTPEDVYAHGVAVRLRGKTGADTAEPE